MIIASSKAMLTVFWNIHRLIPMNSLPRRKSFSDAYFDQKILQPMAAELQREGRLKCRPWILVHIDNAKLHMSNWNLVGMEEL
jgi:hypothetical protein